MERKVLTKVVIADGEYAEIYAPFPGSKEENDRNIKIGILTRLGMKREQIDRIIDSVEVVPDRGGTDGRFDDGPYTPVKLVKIIYEEPQEIPFPEPDPKKRNPGKREPGEIDPEDPDPGKRNPGKPDPRRPDPGKPDPGKPDPGKPDPRKPDPEDPDPWKRNPGKPDPRKPDPGEPDPGKPDPRKPDPGKPDPGKPDPEEPDPGKHDSEEPEKDSAKQPRQTMLQQFYGDREAEARRRKTFDRFKSHITKKMIDTYDEDGKKRSIEVYTVEDYEGKAKDSDELLLDGYQTRLERLSRAHQGDFSPYEREFKKLKTSAIKEIMLKYEEMHKVNPEEAERFKKEAMETIDSFNSPEFKRDVIQALIDQDTEFIETNNYTYNSRQNTAENLKTLGKDGERSVKAQISDEQHFAQRFGLKAMNALITIRNHTKAPINKAIGTYVASPIFRKLLGVTQAKSKGPVSADGYLITPMEDMIATSQKHSRGMYKNKPSHRYHARKDYFIEEEKRKIAQEMAEKSEQSAETGENDGKGKVPRVTVGSLIRLAIVPRIRAITEYREGNAAVLNAGLHDIEEATEERNSQMSEKRHAMIDSMKRIAAYEKEIEDLKALEEITKDPVEKERLAAIIKQRELYKAKLEGILIETKRTEIDSVSTDPISMSQHDKANKANVTTVVRGFKTASRIAAGAYISKYLYEDVLKRGKTPDTKQWIPPEEIETQVTETITTTVPGIAKADVSKITLEDIYTKGSGLLSYYANNLGNKIEDKTSFFRGIAFDYQGKLFSGSDGNGFDPTVLTDVKIDQAINENTTLVSLVQEVLQNKLGKQFTTDQVNDLIASGEISGFDIWRSTSEIGIPMGWLNASEIVPNIISSGSHTITKTVTKTVTEIIPGRWEIIPGEEYFEVISKLNPAVLAAEFGLSASEIADLNEFLRFTRSQEDIQMRSTKKIRRMARENQKRREAKAKEEGIETEDETSKDHIPQPKRRREIKSFQRSNKSKFRRYTHQGDKMKEATEREARKRKRVTVFEGYTGSKKEDLNSGHDENALGTNDRFKQPVLEEEVDR